MKKIAKIERALAGHFLTHIVGDKFPMVGAPRQTSLWLMQPLKIVAREVIGKLAGFYRQFAKKPEELTPAVKEIYRLFDVLKERENSPAMVQMWDDLRVLVCFFLEEDLAYRWRLQVLAEHVDLEKLKPSEEDRYYLERKKDFKYHRE